MKNIISALFLILAVTMFAVTKSSAIEFSLGLSGNTSAYGGFGKETNGSDVTEEYGAFMDAKPSVFFEGNVSDVVSVGLEYTLGDITTPQNTNIKIDTPHGAATSAAAAATNTAQVTFENLSTLYANFKAPWGGLYGKVGLSYADIITQENLGTGGSYGNTDTFGFMLGVGVQKDGDNGMFFRVEVNATQYDDVSARNTTDSTKIVEVTDMMSGSASIRIGRTF